MPTGGPAADSDPLPGLPIAPSQCSTVSGCQASARLLRPLLCTAAAMLALTSWHTTAHTGPGQAPTPPAKRLCLHTYVAARHRQAQHTGCRNLPRVRRFDGTTDVCAGGGRGSGGLGRCVLSNALDGPPVSPSRQHTPCTTRPSHSDCYSKLTNTLLCKTRPQAPRNHHRNVRFAALA